MTDWSNLSLTAKSRKTLETELDAARSDYQKTMQGLDEYADTLAGELFDFDHPDKSIALTDPDSIIDAARNLVEVAQEAADTRYGVQRQAWQQAAGKEFPEYALPDREDWTRVMWDVQKGFANTDYNGLTYRQVMAGKARSGVTIMDLLPKTAGMSFDDIQQAYADFFRSMAVHAAQRRQMANIANDPTRPRWARVPRGSVTCAFCTMLAGRGFVYTSEETAGGGLGNVYHAHCDCEPVPTWGEAKLAGYDPERLDALYREAVRGLPAGASYREILARMRANGDVADSPAAQAGSGDGGKPYKPPKASAAAASSEPGKPKVPHSPGESRILSMRGVSGVSDWEWLERQKAAGVDPSLEVLYPHETVFLERFEALGNHVRWIPRDTENQTATNDFEWLEAGELCELKSMTSTKYQHIAKRISESAASAMDNHGVVKDCYVIDIGHARMSDKLASQLVAYNVRHPDQKTRIRRLFVMDADGLHEIGLK